MNARDSNTIQEGTGKPGVPALDSRADEPISLKQISAFLAVVELHSLGRAAERLHMSQSGLSRVISNLEAAIGERLFLRTPSGLSLTPTGSAFLPYAHKLHSKYCDAVAAARGDTRRSKVWTVACTELVFPLVLPQLISLGAHGGVGGAGWRVVGMKSLQAVTQVEVGRADFGLCMNVREADALDSVTLLRAPLGLLASPQMRLPQTISTLSMLNEIPMARLSEYNMLPGLLGDQTSELTGYFNSPVAADTVDCLYAIVRAGRVATIASAIAASLPSAAGLRFLPLKSILPSIELRLVARTLGRDPFGKAGPALQIRQAVHRLSWIDAVERVEH